MYLRKFIQEISIKEIRSENVFNTHRMQLVNPIGWQAVFYIHVIHKF